MIKRWVVRFEWNRKYRWLPAFSITPMFEHGQIGTDGGQVGTFLNCDKCSGDGTLFVPDEPPSRVRPESNHAMQPAIDFNTSIKNEEGSSDSLYLDVTLSPHQYEVGEKLFTRRAEYKVERVWNAGSQRRVELTKIPGTELPRQPRGDEIKLMVASNSVNRSAEVGDSVRWADKWCRVTFVGPNHDYVYVIPVSATERRPRYLGEKEFLLGGGPEYEVGDTFGVGITKYQVTYVEPGLLYARPI